MSRGPSDFQVALAAIAIMIASVVAYLAGVAAVVFVIVKVLQWTGVL
jgi:hypothetical protein